MNGESVSECVGTCSMLRLKDRTKCKNINLFLRKAAPPQYSPDPIRAQISTMELYFISGALLSSESSLCRIWTSWAFSRSFSAVTEIQVKIYKSGKVWLALILLYVSHLFKRGSLTVVKAVLWSIAHWHKTEAHIRWYDNKNHSSR